MHCCKLTKRCHNSIYFFFFVFFVFFGLVYPSLIILQQCVSVCVYECVGYVTDISTCDTNDWDVTWLMDTSQIHSCVTHISMCDTNDSDVTWLRDTSQTHSCNNACTKKWWRFTHAQYSWLVLFPQKSPVFPHTQIYSALWSGDIVQTS